MQVHKTRQEPEDEWSYRIGFHSYWTTLYVFRIVYVRVAALTRDPVRDKMKTLLESGAG